jgi:hypothetical protein
LIPQSAIGDDSLASGGLQGGREYDNGLVANRGAAFH